MYFQSFARVRNSSASQPHTGNLQLSFELRPTDDPSGHFLMSRVHGLDFLGVGVGVGSTIVVALQSPLIKPKLSSVSYPTLNSGISISEVPGFKIIQYEFPQFR